MEQLNETDWRVLLKSIRQGKCILLLGPGVAVDPTNPEGDPLSIRLTKSLASELQHAGKCDAHVSAGDLAYVALRYEREMPKRRASLEIAIEDFYSPYRNKTTSLHVDLAALPFPLCVSTTPDRFLLNAFNQRANKPFCDFYHFKPDPKHAREAVGRLPSIEHPLIYDLYGSLDETDSLVLTENDLLDFLVSVTRQAPALDSYVTAQFNDPRASFLFLGFGFRHWYVRILLHALKAGGHESQSLALEDAAFFNLPEHEQTALFFQRGHAIDFRQFPADFASQLRRRFEAQTATARRETEIVAQIPPDAPIAFLCHENRDKPRVEELALELRKGGIRVWTDEQNLRGGDDWQKLIPHVIEKQCDYVIVLQSPHMLDKPESYFNVEIHYAMLRQLRFADSRFTIPVLLEPHANLPRRDLQNLHNVDITKPGASAALVETIQEDWHKRKQMNTKET